MLPITKPVRNPITATDRRDARWHLPRFRDDKFHHVSSGFDYVIEAQTRTSVPHRQYINRSCTEHTTSSVTMSQNNVREQR